MLFPNAYTVPTRNPEGKSPVMRPPLRGAKNVPKHTAPVESLRSPYVSIRSS
jgi:hypothetical protein